MAVKLLAPAKVNWHLAVGKRREDGYHNISSIFQTCSISDVLEVEISEGPFSITVKGLEGLCPAGKSTLDKAAVLWHEKTGFDKAISVVLKKNIPSQAGMGGGSSDAATLLLYLNSLLEKPMSRDDLAALGEKVGCDVPFFIYQERSAYVTGLGEIVQPLEKPRDLEGFVIVPTSEKVSTKQAYDKLDSRVVVPELESCQELVDMYQGPVEKWKFRNDFEMVNTKPDISLKEGEVLLLTGSGSCWVLLTKRKKLEEKEGCSFIRATF